MKDRDKHLGMIAFNAWRLAHTAADDKGMALTNHKGVKGRVLPTQVIQFIRAASSVVGGEPLIEDDIKVIRQSLRAGCNMVVLGEFTGKTTEKVFRVFVAEEYSSIKRPASKTREPDAIDKRAKKLTEKEAGEDRAAAPVVVRSPKKREDALSNGQVVVLKYLATHGGMFRDQSGRVSSQLARAAGYEGKTGNLTPALYSLDVSRGYIGRDIRGKRTYAIELTQDGWDKANELLPERKPEPVVEVEPAFEPLPEPAAASVVPREPAEHHKPKSNWETLLIQMVSNLVEREVDAQVGRITPSQELQDDLATATAQLDLIKGVIKDVNNGDRTPLAALGDIEAVLS